MELEVFHAFVMIRGTFVVVGFLCPLCISVCFRYSSEGICTSKQLQMQRS